MNTSVCLMRLSFMCKADADDRNSQFVYLYLYLCDYGLSLQPSFNGKPFLSPIRLRFLSGYLSCAFKCPSLFAFQQLLFLNASQKLPFPRRAGRDERSDKEREKRRWMGKRGAREGIGGRGVYQDGRMKIEKQRLWVSGVKADGTALSGRLPGGEDK